jgi:hypothetical protein
MNKKLITYIEAKTRVCQARFGDDYISGLTGHEEYVLDNPWNLDVSITERRVVSGKANEIEYQQQWADDWLEDRGLVDGTLLAFGQSIPPFSRVAFECDLFASFPESRRALEDLAEPGGANTNTVLVFDAPSRRKKTAPKTEVVLAALRRHGFENGVRGKTCKEIAKLIASDVPGFSTRTPETQSKLVQRALKRLSEQKAV